MSKDFNFNAEDPTNADIQFFKIPNGNDEEDNISDIYKEIREKEISEEINIKKENPYKNVEVNDIEYNINKIGKNVNMTSQNEENPEKILSPDQLILITFTLVERA